MVLYLLPWKKLVKRKCGTVSGIYRNDWNTPGSGESGGNLAGHPVECTGHTDVPHADSRRIAPGRRYSMGVLSSAPALPFRKGRMRVFHFFSCFISSMVITNDASLLLFVPESIWLFRKLKKDDWLPFLVVLETIAANMGSTLLPSGNPQNLYLYFMYGMKFSDFLKITVPITALSGLLLLGILWGRRNEAMALPQQKAPAVRGRQAALFTFLLGAIFLVLLKILVWWMAAIVVIPLAILSDYRLMKKVDWKLLLLFICLFVFAGNMSHMPWVIRHLKGNPLMQGVFWSQIISNVPAAVLLSSVNTQGEMLVAGTDIGGLGTLIASMASLISYRAYKQYTGRSVREYLVIFTGWNILFLVCLLLEAWLIF